MHNALSGAAIDSDSCVILHVLYPLVMEKTINGIVLVYYRPTGNNRKIVLNIIKNFLVIYVVIYINCRPGRAGYSRKTLCLRQVSIISWGQMLA